MAVIVRPHTVHSCPVCDKPHSFRLRITIVKPLLVFAGPDDERVDDSSTHPVTLVCPELGARFTEHVRLTDLYGGRVDRIEMADEYGDGSSGSNLASTVTADPLASVIDAGVGDWVKNSAVVARDYAKSMIGVCTGALPVFFAVLKFLYGDKAASTAWVLAGLCPSILLLAAALAFVFGLRPQLLAVENVEQLVASYQERHQAMNRWNSIGTLLFLGGVFCSVVVWLLALA